VTGAGPLSGVRVVELAGIGPAPFACMLLADLGAEVIRLDRPGMPPLPVPMPPEADLLRRGRPSVVLDLKHPDGLATARELVARADVLVEGYRPGVAERLGLGPDDCLALNPALVYGRMTGWGQDGPLAHAAGHDIGYVAITGAPFYDVYETSDGGWLAVGPLEQPFYAELLRLLGIEDAAPDRLDPRQWPALRALLAGTFATRTRAEWTDLLEGTDACVEPVLSYAEAPHHPHLAARGTYVEHHGVVQPAPAPRFSRTPGALSTPPPRASGVDTRSALEAWGIADVDALLASGASLQTAEPAGAPKALEDAEGS